MFCLSRHHRRCAPHGAQAATPLGALSAGRALSTLARAAALVCGGLACTAGPAWAQTAGQVVEVVGTAPLPGAGLPKDRVPANAQTASATDIAASQAGDLTNFMTRRLGSVYVNEVQNNPLQPDLHYRGFNASPLLGAAQGLSVFVDGVRLNQPFGDVVSWDLVPKTAIASISLNPGSNPLFGLNTLGGALVIQTKDGRRFPGTSLQLSGGSFGRGSLEFETGGSDTAGAHWYATGQAWRESGWRADSASRLGQFFGKGGQRVGDTDLSLTLALADTQLRGNGLQEQAALAADWASVYSRPDITRNRSWLVNLGAQRSVGDTGSLAAQVYVRRIRSSTLNGDVNEDSLDQAVYQPSAAERAALAAAGYSGFPTAGETAANTPFPKWRCIANALLQDEPAEKCTGLINTTHTTQQQAGATLQLEWDGTLPGGLRAQHLLGLALEASRSQFRQDAELGYLNADRSITGVGAFGDGVSGGTVDGEPWDTRVDLTGHSRTASVFGRSVVALSSQAHLTLSARYNRTTVHNHDAITPGGGTGSLDGDHRFQRLNPALGITFTPRAGLNLFAGATQGSRAPSSVELGCADPQSPCKLPNAFAGDPPLRQVVTTTLEAGLRGFGGAGAPSWSAAVFRSDNRDDLLFVADDQSGFGYFRNFGRTRRQGLELGLELPLAPGVALGANYTFLDATFRSAETLNGNANSSNSAALAGFPGVEGTIAIAPGSRMPMVPRQMFKVFAQAQWGAWNFGADVQAVGGSLARGNENAQHQADGVYYLGAGRNPGHAVAGLNMRWRASPALEFFGQVANVFDRRYTSAAQLGPVAFNAAGQFQARPFAADANGDRPLRHGTMFAPGAPRSVSVGLKWSL